MAITPRTPVRQSMPSSLTTLATVPAAQTWELKNVRLVNRSRIGCARVWLYFVASGDTAGTANVWYDGQVFYLDPKQFMSDDFWAPLGAGGTIQGYTDGEVTIHIGCMVRT